MAYGISALQPARKPDGVEKALDLHGFFIGLVAVPLVLISGTIMYQRKEDRGQPHYVSWHGIVGITTVLLAFIQAIFGVLLSWGYLPRKLYRYHRQSGYAVFTILVLAFMLGGLYSNFIVRHAWTATRFLAYGLGPLSVWGGVVARIRSRKLW
ncbi:uncharacterized protein EI90DRAFT_2679150 [Cantharellus anzutake]|nr:uncharacterized protein EI90DRAFT_2679150 [Cantharellus anzutake]KAF8319492.1 hypothetical protein EI90DRAFT_2679150 [Cantharellus anzutake]